MTKGLLITFEGGEGAGKSTQIEMVEDFLRRQGREVLVLREPGGTPIGEAIRTILLSCKHGNMSPRSELLLYEAARAQLVDEVICPALDNGTVVLCDRFFDSTIAYQGQGRAIDLAWIDRLNIFATNGLAPDCTVVIDISPAVGLRRASPGATPDRLESADESFHEAVREGFLNLAARYPRRVRIVEGDRQPVQVFEDIKRIAEEALARV